MIVPLFDGNCIRRLGVEKIVPKAFNDRRPRSILYDMLACTITYHIFSIFCNHPSCSNLLYNQIHPFFFTFSSAKPKSGPSCDRISDSGMSIYLKVIQNRILVEHPWSIRVFLTMQLVISTLITMG